MTFDLKYKISVFVTVVCKRLQNVLISISLDDREPGFGVRGTTSACSYSAGRQPAIRMHSCYRAMIGCYVRVTMAGVEGILHVWEIEVHQKN